MAGTTTARKPRATKPRETAAQRRARLGAEAQRAGQTPAASTTTVAPGLEHVPDLPEVPGGAVELTRGTSALTVPREVLFKRDGVGYSIPTVFSAADTLRYLDLVAFQGSDVAVAWAMRRALGDVGMVALMDADVGDDVMARFVEIVHARLTGITLPKA